MKPANQETVLNKWVFSFFLKLGRLMPGSRRSTGRLFHTAGEETANTRGPIVTIQVRGTRSSNRPINFIDLDIWYKVRRQKFNYDWKGFQIPVSLPSSKLVGVEGHPTTKTLLQYPWVDNWLMAIFPLSGRVKSPNVSPEVWLSTLGQTSDPSLAWKQATFSK